MLKHAFLALLLCSWSAEAGVLAIGEPNVTWTKRKIHVCWHRSRDDHPDYVKNDFNLDQKTAVQQIVEKEYTEEKVGITFYGWEDCATIKNQDYDLEIYQDNDLALNNPMVDAYRKNHVEGAAVLGEGSQEQIMVTKDSETGKIVSQVDGYLNRNLQRSTMYLMVRPMFRLFSDHFQSLEELQATALHEFGHVAGLRHEHIREEAKSDPNCKNRQDTSEEKILDTSAIYETYDPNSIMNYCWGATLVQIGTVVTELPNLPDATLYTTHTDRKTKKKFYRIRVGLSAKDVSSLRKLYPSINP